MNIKKALAGFLQDSDFVRDQVGGRIFGQRAPRYTPLPYLVIRRLGGDVFNDLSGEPDCTESVLDITAHAKSDQSAGEITEAVRNRLSSYVGPMGDLHCLACTLERGPQEFSRKPQDGSDNWRFASSADYRITHSQPLVNHE